MRKGMFVLAAARLEKIATDVESDEIALSLIVCTYRRYDRLRRLVNVLAEHYGHREDLEILIVDNSDDFAARDAFYASFKAPTNLRTIVSHPPGLARARNAGMEAARGKYLAYIDDDAWPSIDWLNAIIESFDTNEDASVVAGPILPVWPSGVRPNWVPRRYEGCLTILDLGNTSRSLEAYEYAYGANMAFRTRDIRHSGGFPTHLGRSGAAALLSNEEIEVQRNIRRSGGKIYYDPRALVYHDVHSDRLSPGWFRRRMAWQVVSDCLLDGGEAKGVDELSSEVAADARRLGISDDFLKAFVDQSDPDVMEAQIDFAMKLTSLMLCSESAVSQDFDRKSQQEDLREGPADSYRERASFRLSGGGTIFTECTPQHEYLYDLYSTIGNTGLLKREIDPWSDYDGLLKFTRLGLTAAQDYRSSLFFLTIDHFLQEAVTDQVVELIRRSGVPAMGALHRVPIDAQSLYRLSQLSAALDQVVVLSKDIKHDIESKCGLSNVVYLPHQVQIAAIPSKSKSAIKARLGIPADRYVISLLGEIRPGKGLELILNALHHFESSLRDRICLLFGGKATKAQILEIEDVCAALNIMVRLGLRHVSDRRQYAAISDLDYADYVRATDVGLLIYQEGQRFGMSGALPCYIGAGATVVATANSYAGRAVLENSLGEVLLEETPEELARSIANAVAQKLNASSDGETPYLLEISDGNVTSILSKILGR